VKKVLSKKILGIPTFLLVGLLVTGVAFGAYVTYFTDSSTVNEPFTAVMTDDLTDIYPGESDTVTIRVSNSAGVNLYAKVYDSITITQSDPDEDGYELTTEDITLTPTSNCLEVPAGGSTDFTFTVSVSPDAEPGSFDLTLHVERVESCP
jgi:uncharacterized membrane protein